MFDCLIIGGGAAGLSCALVLGSANDAPFASDKNIGIVAHQRGSHLNSALLNNALGIQPGTRGSDVLKTGLQHLEEFYPHIQIIPNEKTKEVNEKDGYFEVVNNKSTLSAKIVVIAVGYLNLFNIKGLNGFLEPHPQTQPEKNRVWLKNQNHLLKPGLYVAGTLAGGRSQYAIACGSGAQVATDILTLWNGGKHTKVHDKIY